MYYFFYRYRLKREAAIQYRLNHPNILKLLAIVFEPGSYGLILEFMKHGELSDFLEENNIGWEKKLLLVCDVVLAMCYLHSQKPPIIHGDLKIQNVLIGEELKAKVCD